MNIISKLISNSVIDFAAEELKKYLRMMMPDSGDVKIVYAPDATDGFRLGLMQDFGLDVSDAEDVELDDIIYIDCNENGGIVAGDNPRSVLLAVYEYLRQNGCRWLYPGVDGEYIPMKDIIPVKYRHKPSCRYRGQCNEGAENQQCMMEAIDFAPKLGMNVFMLEFKIPTAYYDLYYEHLYNEENRVAEPVTMTQILQWKRMCETEIAKRGLQFHDIGHGWTVDPFGIDSSLRDPNIDHDAGITDEQRQYLALVDGERKIKRNRPCYTQFCMGNGKARGIVAKYVADYAENHSNVDYLHVWLGDSVNSQCECDLCRKKTPSDWYMILLNEIDEQLTRKKLATRIVFICYIDTIWAPLEEKLKNSSRFTMLFAPISRRYTSSVSEKSLGIELRPYTRNTLVMPRSLAENLAYYDEWRKIYNGSSIAYEYHFWRHQYFDFSGITLARRVNEDVKGYKRRGINGIIEDGSQRSFFPNGFAFYAYARTLFDISIGIDTLKEDYFSHIYGKDWRSFADYLEKLGDLFGFAYLEGEESTDLNRSPYYSPKRAEIISGIEKILAEGEALIKSHYNCEFRVQTVSVRLLEYHVKYARLMAMAIIEKAKGNDKAADEALKTARIKMGSYEREIQDYYDHMLNFHAWKPMFSVKTASNEPIIY